MGETIYTQKRSYFSLVKSNFFKKSDKKITGVIVLKDKEIINFLKEGFKHLPTNILFINEEENILTDENINFTKKLNNDLYLGFDFIVLDNDFEGLNNFLQAGVCPIIPKNNHLSSILKEFDPIKSEGNSFLYEDNNKWSIFYAVIRYLENYKFPYDNRNLVKNITSI